MASAYTIRQQNFAEMQKNLNAVNSVLKSSIRLRGKFEWDFETIFNGNLNQSTIEIINVSLFILVGKYAAKMMPLFKLAVKNKNIQAIVRIIEIGED